jgi:hypothetical protein
MTRRKPNHQRQIAAALTYWQTSMAFLKECNHDETQDQRTDDVAACPQRQGEEAGDDEDRSEPAHLGEGN